MALNFKVRDAQTTVNATSLGTVANAIGKGGKVRFIHLPTYLPTYPVIEFNQKHHAPN